MYKIIVSDYLIFLDDIKNMKCHRCHYILRERDGSSRCGLLFKSANQLKEHRRQAGHQSKRKKKEATRTTKQLRIDEVFYQQKSDDENDESDSENDGVSEKCKICMLFSSYYG